MKEAEIRDTYGWAEIDPAGPVVAGSTGTWRIIYHVGRQGIDDGGSIKVVCRGVNDWERPQFDDPDGPGFASVSTTGPASLRVHSAGSRYFRPWSQAVTIDVFDDSLSEGDSVTLTLGDTSRGGPGCRAQTFCQQAFEFRVAVDWCATWVYEEVPSPSVPIVSGPAHRLVVVCPTEAVPGEETWVGVKAEDLWGNPSRDYEGEVHIDSSGLGGLPEAYRFRPEDRGVHRFDGLTATRTGVCRVRVEDVGYGLTGRGNPLVCVEAGGDTRPFWGDLHGQSEETVGTDPVASYFRFAKESALVDFIGHSGNDFQVTREAWEEIKKQANAQYEPGRFVTFIGYEWSGNTPVGGDRNVYYAGSDGPIHRSGHVLIADKSDADTDCWHVEDLFKTLRGRDALITPHVGGRYANLTWHDPELEPALEIYSKHGEFEWFLREALERGYQMGFVCGSDDHRARPGAAYQGSGGLLGGLTCFYAQELTREGLWEALKARRCYGTTGQRIVLSVTADGHPMGSAFEADAPPEIVVHAIGTAAIERVDVFRGVDCVYAFPETTQRDAKRVRVSWSGQRIRSRSKRVSWDGSLTIDKGMILKAENYAIDSPEEGIQEVAGRSVSWTSTTFGDADGLVLTLDAPADAMLAFQTRVLGQSVSLGEIDAGPVVVDAGGVDMKVTFERLPIGVGEEVSFAFREDQLEPGCHPYWVRVLQVDGAKAWASPVYVTLD